MATTTQLPVAPGLFTYGDDPHLLGSRCPSCGIHTFPRQPDCPRCSNAGMEDVELATTGTLWTWTTQPFRPKTPPYMGESTDETFEPFLVGYVELAGQVKVEAQLVGVTADDIAIGQEMELVLVPFRHEGETELLTYAFRPRR